MIAAASDQLPPVPVPPSEVAVGDQDPSFRGVVTDWLPSVVPSSEIAADHQCPSSEPPASDETNPLEGLIERAATNRGAPFEIDVLEALAELKYSAPASFEVLRTELKAIGCRVTALDKAVAGCEGDGDADSRRGDSGSRRVGQDPHYGSRFTLTEEGVMYFDPNSEKEPLRVCGPLKIVAATRDTKGDGWGRLLEWSDPEGRRHEWAMPMALLAGDGNEYKGRLLDGGLFITPGRDSGGLLASYIQGTQTDKMMLSVSPTGWHRDVFVLPGATVGLASGDAVVFQTANDSEHLYNVSGSAEDWRTNVGVLCSGNTRLLLTVSCAFAGPLLLLAGEESGGFHLCGKTSDGKTTALLVGGSVNGGGGPNGFAQTWRATANGLEAVAEQHNDSTLFLDELAQLDAKEAADTAYLLGNGSGKVRMTRSIVPRRKLTWRLVFVSSGEVTLADHALTAGKRTKGGAEVRLLNVDADAGAGMGLFENIHHAESADAFSRELREASKRHYGSPLREYLVKVVGDRENVEKAIREYRADFVNRNVPPGASGEVSRAAFRFALVGFAGEFATESGITGWVTGEATRAAECCFMNWLSNRLGGKGAGDAAAAIRQVRAFIERNGASRFQPAKVRTAHGGGQLAEKVFNRAGFRVDDGDGEALEYLILPEAFRSEVCDGFDHKMVANALSERVWLDNESPHLTKTARVPELGKTRFYAVRALILNE